MQIIEFRIADLDRGVGVFGDADTADREETGGGLGVLGAETAAVVMRNCRLDSSQMLLWVVAAAWGVSSWSVPKHSAQWRLRSYWDDRF